jgi:predicted XRE-type DNA-binding protein
MVEIHKVILTKPFDQAALNAAFDAQRARVSNVTKDAQAAFVAIVAGMSDKERQTFVKTLEEQMRKWQEKHQRKPKPQ